MNDILNYSGAEVFPGIHNVFFLLARCSDGQLRLAEGSDTYYGRVEICSDQRWNALSSARSLWSYTNANIACIELGFRCNYYINDIIALSEVS